MVTGATGFIGPHILKLLDRPIVLARNPAKANHELAEFHPVVFNWDPMRDPAPLAAFDGVEAVIHLAGEGVASGRWTAEKKRLIRESRVQGTRHLVQTLAKLDQKPKVLVCASATGIYGNRGDDILDESAPAVSDFLAEVCASWEREAQAATKLGIRVVSIRTGIVLGREGGALKKMLLPFKLGAGGRLGNGRQWMPWIHVDDLAALYLRAAADPQLAGPVNGSAPNPVTNREFTKQLAAELHRPAILPAPYLGLRIVFGEFAKVLFDSQRAIPKAALTHGFDFRYPELAMAMGAIFKSGN
jgi:uncharacterized protein (TIGR01777 family)